MLDVAVHGCLQIELGPPESSANGPGKQPPQCVMKNREAPLASDQPPGRLCPVRGHVLPPYSRSRWRPAALFVCCLLLMLAPLPCAAASQSAAGTLEETALRASALHTQGRYAEAESTFRAALNDAAAAGRRDATVALILTNLALVCQNTGKPVEAERHYARSLALFEALAGKSAPILRYPLASFASLALENGQARKAERLYRRALALPLAAEYDYEEEAMIQHGLGMALQAQGRLEDAESCLRQAVGLRSRPDGERVSLAQSLSSLALVHLSRGQMAEALADQLRALELLEAVLPAGHPEFARPLSNLAAIYAQMERPAEAEPALRRALEIASSTFGEEHEVYGGILSNYAEVLRQLHRKQEAKRYAARAKSILANAAAGRPARHTIDLADLPR